MQLGLALIVMFPTTFAPGLGLSARSRVQPEAPEPGWPRRSAGFTRPIHWERSSGQRSVVSCSFRLLGVGTTLIGVAAVQFLLGAALARGAKLVRGPPASRSCLVGAAGCVALRPSWDLLLMNSGVYMNVQNFDRSAGW